jgi:hypothetical protein
MNLAYSNRGVPKQPVTLPPSSPQQPVQLQPARAVSIANRSMFERTVKPEGGCGCGGGH